jgi:hypothetical protein
MKKVFSSNATLAHVWASQSQETGKANSMFFQGTEIYSYGRHYCIAKLFGKVALVNSNGYSNSTAKHTRHVRRAITHLATFDVPNVYNPTAQENITYLANQVADSMKHLIKCLNVCTWNDKGEIYEVDRIQHAVKKFNLYCETFNIQDSITLDEETLADLKAIHAEKLVKTKLREAARTARQAVEYAERQKANEARWAKEELEYKESVKAWKLFQGSIKGYSDQVFLRINQEKNLVETSRGADVPLDEALSLIMRINRNEAVQGVKIGSFEVKELTPSHLVIGCHNIPLEEMNKVFSLTGVNNA